MVLLCTIPLPKVELASCCKEDFSQSSTATEQ